MYRRNPTRIELKLDDMHEYEQKKDEMNDKNKEVFPWLHRAEKNVTRSKEERIGLTNYAYISYVILFTRTSLLRLFTTVFYQIVIVFVFWSHTRASFSDPGVVQLPSHSLDFSGEPMLKSSEDCSTNDTQNWSICNKCDAYRPPRAHHCRVCQRCIKQMDHHCPWINNCVGEMNQKFFLQFLFYVGILCSITVISILIEFMENSNRNQNQLRAIHCIILLIESLLFGIFAIAVFTDQVQVILTNESSIDRFKNYHRRQRGVPQRKSLKEAIRQGSLMLWLLPIRGRENKRLSQFIV